MIATPAGARLTWRRMDSLWTASYCLLVLLLLRAFFRVDAALVAGILACAALATGTPRGKASARWGWIALLMALLYVCTPLTTLRFFALGASGIFMLEMRRGRQSPLLPLSLLIMSPVFGNLCGVLSFPLRLELTRIAGAVLKVSGQRVVSGGNLITRDGVDFSVDPACMGLHMLQTALLCCIMMSALYGQRYRRELRGACPGLLIGACVLLNVVANLLRIVMLVQFRVPQENPMHELIGILCIVVYTLLPCAFLIRWMMRRFGRDIPMFRPAVSRKEPWLHCVIILTLICGVAVTPAYVAAQHVLPEIPGYESAYAAEGIPRLTRGSTVVYLKGVQGFYGTEHHPMLCWTGSGFRFRDVCECRVGGVPVMRGVLERGGKRYLTAWWYASAGGHRYSGAGWRWDALRNGRRYCIVNVTAADSASLDEQVRSLGRSRQLEAWMR